MLQIACQEIRDERAAFERRRRDDRRRDAVMSALDGILAELEDLCLAGVVMAPAAYRARVAALVAHVFGLAEPPSVPGPVTDLIDVVFATQEAALIRHRRARWGLSGR
jgi:hypothetical protein